MYVRILFTSVSVGIRAELDYNAKMLLKRAVCSKCKRVMIIVSEGEFAALKTHTYTQSISAYHQQSSIQCKPLNRVSRMYCVGIVVVCMEKIHRIVTVW